MSYRNLPAAMGAILFIVSSTSASAIEPDAPFSLISREEAIVFSVRQRIGRLPPAKEYGEKADRIALGSYYAARLRAPLWVDHNGLNDRAKKVSDEISKANSWGLDVSHFDLPPRSLSLTEDPKQMIDYELRMSLAVLKYARHARGGRMNPKKLSLDIDRTPSLEDPHTILKNLAEAPDPAAYLRKLHPQHAQFIRLRDAYRKALKDEAGGPAATVRSVHDGKEKPARKRRPKSASRLSNRLLYNMEMWRWMPQHLGERYVAANIPEYRVRVMEADRVVHSERMVVGKVQNKTPMFSDEMETVVFHPFWNVPNSIKVKELLPSLIRGGSALAKQGLKLKFRGQEVNPRSVNWSTTDIRKFHVYQPPSRRNALGVVKFLFPNKHAIYFHDTPSKHLFKRKARAYSHGCMRVRNPLKFAEVLLSHDKGWGRRRIDSLVSSGPKNNQISLSRKIPVHVLYFTTWIDDRGRLSLFKDIYGHEKRIQMGLSGKSHLIVKRKRDLNEARRRVVANVTVEQVRKPPRDQAWRRRILGN